MFHHKVYSTVFNRSLLSSYSEPWVDTSDVRCASCVRTAALLIRFLTNPQQQQSAEMSGPPAYNPNYPGPGYPQQVRS